MVQLLQILNADMPIRDFFSPLCCLMKIVCYCLRGDVKFASADTAPGKELGELDLA